MTTSTAARKGGSSAPSSRAGLEHTAVQLLRVLLPLVLLLSTAAEGQSMRAASSGPFALVGEDVTIDPASTSAATSIAIHELRNSSFTLCPAQRSTAPLWNFIESTTGAGADANAYSILVANTSAAQLFVNCSIRICHGLVSRILLGSLSTSPIANCRIEIEDVFFSGPTTKQADAYLPSAASTEEAAARYLEGLRVGNPILGTSLVLRGCTFRDLSFVRVVTRDAVKESGAQAFVNEHFGGNARAFAPGGALVGNLTVQNVTWPNVNVSAMTPTTADVVVADFSGWIIPDLEQGGEPIVSHLASVSLNDIAIQIHAQEWNETSKGVYGIRGPFKGGEVVEVRRNAVSINASDADVHCIQVSIGLRSVTTVEDNSAWARHVAKNASRPTNDADSHIGIDVVVFEFKSLRIARSVLLVEGHTAYSTGIKVRAWLNEIRQPYDFVDVVANIVSVSEGKRKRGIDIDRMTMSVDADASVTNVAELARVNVSGNTVQVLQEHLNALYYTPSEHSAIRLNNEEYVWRGVSEVHVSNNTIVWRPGQAAYDRIVDLSRQAFTRNTTVHITGNALSCELSGIVTAVLPPVAQTVTIRQNIIGATGGLRVFVGVQLASFQTTVPLSASGVLWITGNEFTSIGGKPSSTSGLESGCVDLMFAAFASILVDGNTCTHQDMSYGTTTPSPSNGVEAIQMHLTPPITNFDDGSPVKINVTVARNTITVVGDHAFPGSSDAARNMAGVHVTHLHHVRSFVVERNEITVFVLARLLGWSLLHHRTARARGITIAASPIPAALDLGDCRIVGNIIRLRSDGPSEGIYFYPHTTTVSATPPGPPPVLNISHNDVTVAAAVGTETRWPGPRAEADLPRVVGIMDLHTEQSVLRTASLSHNAVRITVASNDIEGIVIAKQLGSTSAVRENTAYHVTDNLIEISASTACDPADVDSGFVRGLRIDGQQVRVPETLAVSRNNISIDATCHPHVAGITVLRVLLQSQASSIAVSNNRVTTVSAERASPVLATSGGIVVYAAGPGSRADFDGNSINVTFVAHDSPPGVSCNSAHCPARRTRTALSVWDTGGSSINSLAGLVSISHNAAHISTVIRNRTEQLSGIAGIYVRNIRALSDLNIVNNTVIARIDDAGVLISANAQHGATGVMCLNPSGLTFRIERLTLAVTCTGNRASSSAGVLVEREQGLSILAPFTALLAHTSITLDSSAVLNYGLQWRVDATAGPAITDSTISVVGRSHDNPPLQSAHAAVYASGYTGMAPGLAWRLSMQRVNVSVDVVVNGSSTSSAAVAGVESGSEGSASFRLVDVAVNVSCIHGQATRGIIVQGDGDFDTASTSITVSATAPTAIVGNGGGGVRVVPFAAGIHKALPSERPTNAVASCIVDTTNITVHTRGGGISAFGVRDTSDGNATLQVTASRIVVSASLDNRTAAAAAPTPTSQVNLLTERVDVVGVAAASQQLTLQRTPITIVIREVLFPNGVRPADSGTLVAQAGPGLMVCGVALTAPHADVAVSPRASVHEVDVDITLRSYVEDGRELPVLPGDGFSHDGHRAACAAVTDFPAPLLVHAHGVVIVPSSNPSTVPMFVAVSKLTVRVDVRHWSLTASPAWRTTSSLVLVNTAMPQNPCVGPVGCPLRADVSANDSSLTASFGWGGNSVQPPYPSGSLLQRASLLAFNGSSSPGSTLDFRAVATSVTGFPEASVSVHTLSRGATDSVTAVANPNSAVPSSWTTLRINDGCVNLDGTRAKHTGCKAMYATSPTAAVPDAQLHTIGRRRSESMAIGGGSEPFAFDLTACSATTSRTVTPGPTRTVEPTPSHTASAATPSQTGPTVTSSASMPHTLSRSLSGRTSSLTPSFLSVTPSASRGTPSATGSTTASASRSYNEPRLSVVDPEAPQRNSVVDGAWPVLNGLVGPSVRGVNVTLVGGSDGRGGVDNSFTTSVGQHGACRVSVALDGQRELGVSLSAAVARNAVPELKDANSSAVAAYLAAAADDQVPARLVRPAVNAGSRSPTSVIVAAALEDPALEWQPVDDFELVSSGSASLVPDAVNASANETAMSGQLRYTPRISRAGRMSSRGSNASEELAKDLKALSGLLFRLRLSVESACFVVPPVARAGVYITVYVAFAAPRPKPEDPGRVDVPPPLTATVSVVSVAGGALGGAASTTVRARTQSITDLGNCEFDSAQALFAVQAAERDQRYVSGVDNTTAAASAIDGNAGDSVAQEPIPLFDAPIPLVVGGSVAAGAVLGNVLVLVLFMLLHFASTRLWLHVRLQDPAAELQVGAVPAMLARTRQGQLAAIAGSLGRCPSIEAVVFAYLLETTVSSAVAVLVAPPPVATAGSNDTVQSLVCVTALLIFAAVSVAAVWPLTQREASFPAVFTQCDQDGETSVAVDSLLDRCAPSTDSILRRALSIVMRSGGDWSDKSYRRSAALSIAAGRSDDSERRVLRFSLVRTIGLLFIDYLPQYRYWIGVEFALAWAVGIVDGLMRAGNCGQGQGWALVLILVTYFAATAKLRPHEAWHNLGFTLVLAGGQAVASACIAMALSLRNNGATESESGKQLAQLLYFIGELTLIVVSFLTLLRGFYDAIRATLRMLRTRLVKTIIGQRARKAVKKGQQPLSDASIDAILAPLALDDEAVEEGELAALLHLAIDDGAPKQQERSGASQPAMLSPLFPTSPVKPPPLLVLDGGAGDGTEERGGEFALDMVEVEATKRSIARDGGNGAPHLHQGGVLVLPSPPPPPRRGGGGESGIDEAGDEVTRRRQRHLKLHRSRERELLREAARAEAEARTAEAKVRTAAALLRATQSSAATQAHLQRYHVAQPPIDHDML